MLSHDERRRIREEIAIAEERTVTYTLRNERNWNADHDAELGRRLQAVADLKALVA